MMEVIPLEDKIQIFIYMSLYSFKRLHADCLLQFFRNS